MNCTICKLPLPKDSPSFMKMHDECVNCIYCKHEVGLDLIEKRIKEQRVSASDLGPSNDSIENPISIFHDYCYNKHLEEDYKQKPVTITQGHLDMLNAANLMFKAQMDLSVSTNQKQAELESYKWMHEKSIEEIFVSIKRMEAVCAMWSITLSKEKGRILTKLAEAERIRYKEIRQDESKLEFEKKKEKKNVNLALQGKLTPEEKQKEKAVAALMMIMKCSREKALEQLDKVN